MDDDKFIQKLYTTGLGNSHADLCLIIADLSGNKLEEVVTTLPEFRQSNKLAGALTTLPALEVTIDGQDHLLTSSITIAQYLASMGSQPELNGKTAFERGQVDMWLQIIRQELQPLTRAVCYQAFGHVECNTVEHQYVYGLLKDALKIPNNHLKGKSYFVGGYLTIPDIFFTLVQQELQQGILDINCRNSMSNINSHFKNIASTCDAVKRHCGNLKQGKKQITPILLGEISEDFGKDLNKQQKKENSKQKATKQK